MLIIRREQNEVLQIPFEKVVAERITAHVRDVFPEHYAQLGDARLSEVVGQAQADARGLGLESDYEVCEYVNLVFVFGSGFHRLREHAWFLEILLDPGINDVMDKFQRIRNRTVEILQKRLQQG